MLRGTRKIRGASFSRAEGGYESCDGTVHRRERAENMMRIGAGGRGCRTVKLISTSTRRICQSGWRSIYSMEAALFKKFCKRDFCDEVRDFKIPEPEAVAS